MVAPIENVRPVQGQPIGRISPRPAAGESDFAAILERLTKSGATPASSNSTASPTVAAEDLLANIEQATQSMQRASAFISSARAYYRAGGAMHAEQPDQPAPTVDSRG